MNQSGVGWGVKNAVFLESSIELRAVYSALDRMGGVGGVTPCWQLPRTLPGPLYVLAAPCDTTSTHCGALWRVLGRTLHGCGGLSRAGSASGLQYLYSYSRSIVLFYYMLVKLFMYSSCRWQRWAGCSSATTGW